jgi:hypothetical protein
MLVPLVHAEDCLKANLPDDDYEVRATAMQRLLSTYYASLDLEQEESTPLRYEAAFFYLSNGQVNDANNLLEKEFDHLDDIAPEDEFYLAWLYARYKSSLTESNRLRLEERANEYEPSTGEGESIDFLQIVTQFLYDRGNGEAGAQNNLLNFIEQRATRGWRDAVSPHGLALVTKGLAALFSEANQEADAPLHTMAEMALDLIFARQAALQTQGVFGGIRAGDYPEHSFYPMKSPWYGWLELLLDTGTSHSYRPEPSLLLSSYHVNTVHHGIVHRCSAVDATFQNGCVAKESFHPNYRSITLTTPDYILTSSQDVDRDNGNVFQHDDGYLTRASIRFRNDPFSYLDLSVRTSPTGTDERGAGDNLENDPGRLYADEHLILGRLGFNDASNPCSEPHLFLGKGFEIIKEDTTVLLFRHVASDTYFAFQFLGGQQVAPIQQRYAPMSGSIAPHYSDVADDGKEFGRVVFPKQAENRGLFVLERVSPTYMDWADDAYGWMIPEGINLNDVLVSFQSGLLVYESRLQVAPEDDVSLTTSEQKNRYEFNVNDGSFTYQEAMGQATGFDNENYAAQQILGRGNKDRYDPITREGDTWTLTGTVPNGNTLFQYTLDLDFSAREPSDMKVTTHGSYACWESASTATGSGTVELGDEERRLAFVAATMLKARDEHVMACGEPTQVLPNYNSGTVIQKACALSYDDKHAMGFVYNPDQTDFATIIGKLNNYFPFVEDPLDATVCNAAITAPPSTFDYLACSSTGTQYLIWVSPGSQTIIIADDPNLFSDSMAESLFTFLLDLFQIQDDEPGASLDDLGRFSRAYFAQEQGLVVVGREQEDTATILFTDFVDDLAPYAALLGTDYRGEGTTQTLSFSKDEETWKQLTSSLRLTARSGTPHVVDLSESCGNGIIESHEACDASVNDEDACPLDPDPTHRKACVNCHWDESACSPCLDPDQDGYYSAGNCDPLGDCDNRDPNTLSGICNPTNGWSAPYGDDPKCRDSDYASCPQCRHPSAPEVVGDGIDGNCDNGEAPGASGTRTCDDESDCDRVCNLEIHEPVCEHDCSEDATCNAVCAADPLCEEDPDCSTTGSCALSCIGVDDCPSNLHVEYECLSGCCAVSEIISPGACFIGSTPILLPDGSTAPIETIVPGEQVAGYDEEREVATNVVVERVFVHQYADELLILNQELHVTPGHHLLTKEGWRAATTLAVGDLVQTPDGSFVSIDTIDRYYYEGPVYNLHNQVHHNYVAAGMLVHNEQKIQLGEEPQYQLP